MAEFRCRLDIPEVQGLRSNELTVGREVLLTCDGRWPSGWNEKTPLQAELPAHLNQTFKILRLEKLSDETMQVTFTLYAVGPWKEPMILTDGTERVDLGVQSMEVLSVLDPKEPRDKPYGLFGPLGLSVPPSWILFGFALVISLVSIAVLELNKRLQRRRLLEFLNRHQSVLSPLQEFHQTMRILKRESSAFTGQSTPAPEVQDAILKIHSMVNLFLTRRFLLPVERWSEQAFMRALRRENRGLSAKTLVDLRRLLLEFREARKSTVLKERDAIQLAEESRRLMETMDKEGSRRS